MLHLEFLFIDEVYRRKKNGGLVCHRVKAPSTNELNSLVAKTSQRIARHLQKQGLLKREDENSYLTMARRDDNAMTELQGPSISYRIAAGPQQGRKVFTLLTIPAWEDSFSRSQIGKVAGFHGVLAGVLHHSMRKHRINVTPARRGKGSPMKSASNNNPKLSAESHKSLTWAKRLKQVYNMEFIECIEDPEIIEKILRT